MQDVLFAKPVEFVLGSFDGTHFASFNREVQGIKSVLSVENARRKTWHDHRLAVGFSPEDVWDWSSQGVNGEVGSLALGRLLYVAHQALQAFVDKQRLDVPLFIDFQSGCAFLASQVY